MRHFLDADILIWQLRGENKAADFLTKLHDEADGELWTGAMQRAEILFFMRPAEEPATMRLLSRIKTAPVDHSVVDAAGELFRKWNKSHGTDQNDAILAATVQLAGGVLHTLNTKHYPMPDLIVRRAW